MLPMPAVFYASLFFSFFFFPFSFVRATAETKLFLKSLPVKVVLQLSMDHERGEAVFHLLKIVRKLCLTIY